MVSAANGQVGPYVHAQATRRSSLASGQKPDRPTAARPIAASRAMPARPPAPRCCLIRLTRPLRHRRRFLDVVRLPAATPVFQVHRRGSGSPLPCTRREVLSALVGCARRGRRLRWDRRRRDLGRPPLEISRLRPDHRWVALRLPLRRGIRGRKMTREVLVEPMYDAVLRASTFLSVLPTKILYFPHVCFLRGTSL